MDRLQKVIARAGIASRRKAEELISAGEVKVNGIVITEMGLKVDPKQDFIEVCNQPLKDREEVKIYLLLHKPKGYVTTVKDPQGRPTVLDLVKVPQRIYPVGRLDYDTSGLLILTNDGDLTYALTHPKHEVNKVYQARVKGHPAKNTLDKLRQGILLDDGPAAPAKVKQLKAFRDSTLLEITIHEGRNRQVRRMCDAIGHEVADLKRVTIGSLQLGALQPGEYVQTCLKTIQKNT